MQYERSEFAHQYPFGRHDEDFERRGGLRREPFPQQERRRGRNRDWEQRYGREPGFERRVDYEQPGGEGYYYSGYDEPLEYGHRGRPWEAHGLEPGWYRREPWVSRPGYGGRDLGPSREHGEFRGRGPRGYRRSDDRILEDACDMLTDSDIDVGDVTVTVDDGEITLEGTVGSRREKRYVEDIVCEVHGVRDCHNNLRIAASSERHSTAGASEPPDRSAQLGEEQHH
ncbi:BON domain-containing protein [Paraliomyxa miuraensis]|uniref:BON domain-containing protein n=1 Tax=Paraliomyxa miuraensis TaxID=376150 RepID=UPI00225B495D|nr:BON domain-containing protein [Paraliomyxa miuraensis]MCX4240299.1 BON domain-containing protein [Paraliomyxa miuraensis]